MSFEDEEIANTEKLQGRGGEGLQPSSVNMEAETDEDELHYHQNTNERILNEGDNDEVDDSGMEAGLESDSDEEQIQEAAPPANDLVVLDPDHVIFTIHFPYRVIIHVLINYLSKRFFH